MSLQRKPTAFDLLVGKGAYATLPSLLEGLRTEHVGMRPEGFAHSLYQLLWHIVHWQDARLAELKGTQARAPESAADGWPATPGPEEPGAWVELLERFVQDASALDVLAAEAEASAEPEQRLISHAVAEVAIHNAYHAGQIAQLRRALGLWPPPAGGGA